MPRNYRREYLKYYGKDMVSANSLQRKHRKHKGLRNKARGMMARAFGIPRTELAGDVDHIDGDPFHTSYDNLLLTSIYENRGFKNKKRHFN